MGICTENEWYGVTKTHQLIISNEPFCSLLSGRDFLLHWSIYLCEKVTLLLQPPSIPLVRNPSLTLSLHPSCSSPCLLSPSLLSPLPSLLPFPCPSSLCSHYSCCWYLVRFVISCCVFLIILGGGAAIFFTVQTLKLGEGSGAHNDTVQLTKPQGLAGGGGESAGIFE